MLRTARLEQRHARGDLEHRYRQQSGACSARHSDFKALARQICVGGLGYSPYARKLSELFIAKFSAQDVTTFKTNRNQYVWGTYDGTGSRNELTPLQYHRKFVYDIDYRSRAVTKHLSKQKVANEPELAALNKSYPDADAIIYRHEGTPKMGHKDARELILLFRQLDGQWCLTGIADSEDTI